MIEKIDSIIFDVDGTIWDSTQTCAEAWNHVLETASDLPPIVEADRLKGLFGLPMDEIFLDIFPGMDLKEVARLGKLCEEYENQILPTHPGTSYPLVYETMKELTKHVSLYIVSNCQSGYIEVCMDALKLTPFIKDHTCYGDRLVSKGENIRYLCEKNHLEHPVYVGDTAGDEKACREAGVKVLYASYGFGRMENPDGVLTKFSDLLSFVVSKT